MADWKETHRGHRIVIKADGGGSKLLVDDEEINVLENADGSFSADKLVYHSYGSLAELGREIAERLPHG